MLPSVNLCDAWAVIGSRLVVCRATLSAGGAIPAAVSMAQRPNLDQAAAILDRVWLSLGFRAPYQANERLHSGDQPTDVVFLTLFREQRLETVIGVSPSLPRHVPSPQAD